jgi:hypothetical protein
VRCAGFHLIAQRQHVVGKLRVDQRRGLDPALDRERLGLVEQRVDRAEDLEVRGDRRIVEGKRHRPGSYVLRRYGRR